MGKTWRWVSALRAASASTRRTASSTQVRSSGRDRSTSSHRIAPRLTGTHDSGFLFEPSAPFLGRWYGQPKLLPTLEALCSVHLPPTPQHIRSTFNEIRQGVPGISTALLAQRL